jgi:2',3'-cyclic-nucleotide 2'-phosphodiesterase / 3'-nucleotidase / 5'-nucleotidase
VTLQENNAIAVVQLNQCRVARIMPIGAKHHGLPENSLDTSDREIDSGKGRIAIRSWQNLHALYQPDSIASYEADDGETYLVIANEGDVRDTAISGRASTDAVRVGSLSLDSTAFPPVPAAVSPDPDPKSSKNLGRLNVIRSLGCEVPLDANAFCPGEYNRLYAYGGRSFSIVTNDGTLVYDSANDFESIIASKVGSGELAKQAFNSTSGNNSAGAVPGESNNTFDSRSDDKGPEPEGVVVGRVGDRTYAFVGLERIGGLMVYDVTDPRDAFYVTYVNGSDIRDFGQPVCTTVSSSGSCTSGIPNAAAGDLGPEGLAFVPASDSPNGKALVIVGNEISGSTRVYEVVATD